MLGFLLVMGREEIVILLTPQLFGRMAVQAEIMILTLIDMEAGIRQQEQEMAAD